MQTNRGEMEEGGRGEEIEARMREKQEGEQKGMNNEVNTLITTCDFW